MLRVKAEIDMFGQGVMHVDAGTLEIVNDGTGTREVGNYRWELLSPKGEVMDKGTIHGHVRANGAWPLIRDILDGAQVYNLTPNARRAAETAFQWGELKSLVEVSGAGGMHSSGGPVAA